MTGLPTGEAEPRTLPQVVEIVLHGALLTFAVWVVFEAIFG